MLEMSRRNMLAGTAVTAVGATVGACSTTGTFVLSPAVIDAITAITTATCNAIPLITTLVAMASARFPALNGVAVITAAVAQEVADIFCKAVAVTPPASGELSITVNGVTVPIHGYHIVNGKFVSF